MGAPHAPLPRGSGVWDCERQGAADGQGTRPDVFVPRDGATVVPKAEGRLGRGRRPRYRWALQQTAHDVQLGSYRQLIRRGGVRQIADAELEILLGVHGDDHGIACGRGEEVGVSPEVCAALAADLERPPPCAKNALWPLTHTLCDPTQTPAGKQGTGQLSFSSGHSK